MWIGSQNRYSLIDADRIIMEHNCIYQRNENVRIVLGSYSSEENALKVMDMIQNAITGTRFEFTDIVRDCDLAGI
ncbi:MAG: hypothetical protein SPK79_06895 [Erysipelotrichaceae bacterium]|nr:hypothetical protein [Erysipelotrichaceae bacterium]